jgi:hypothetical protein
VPVVDDEQDEEPEEEYAENGDAEEEDEEADDGDEDGDDVGDAADEPVKGKIGGAAPVADVQGDEDELVAADGDEED